VQAKGLDATALLNQRLDFILINTAAEAGADVAGLSRTELRQLHRRHLPDLPEEYHKLTEVLRWISQGGRQPVISRDSPAACWPNYAPTTSANYTSCISKLSWPPIKNGQKTSVNTLQNSSRVNI